MGIAPPEAGRADHGRLAVGWLAPSGRPAARLMWKLFADVA